MKIIEIAQKLDKSNENEEWINTEELGRQFGIDVPYVKQDRLKSFWVGNWYCTDTYVGYRMYFFDDEPVAFSVQNGRKSNEDFEWFSLESATKVRDYLLTLITKEVELHVTICDVNEEIGDSFKIAYNSQILNTENVTFNGEKVTLLERIKNKPYDIDTIHKIQLPSGETKEVEIEELDFGFHVIQLLR